MDQNENNEKYMMQVLPWNHLQVTDQQHPQRQHQHRKNCSCCNHTSTHSTLIMKDSTDQLQKNGMMIESSGVFANSYHQKQNKNLTLGLITARRPFGPGGCAPLPGRLLSRRGNYF